MELIQKIKGPQFEKTSAKTLLGDNPSTYPSELIANLYKQHPYLGKYQVNISIEGQDPSMGYMYGVFMVSHASDVPPEPGVKRMGEVISQGAQSPDPSKTIRIPIIVDNKKAHSFDVFITSDGRFLPLNESRVSAALFETSPFAVAPRPAPASAGAMGSSMPIGAQGREAPMSGVTKTSSALFSHIDKDEVRSFVSSISKEASLSNAYQINPVFSEALHRLVEMSSEKEVVKEASADFTSAVISKVGGGFKIKTSNALDIGPEVVVSNKEAESVLPVEIRQQVIKTGSALMTPSENRTLESIEYTDGLSDVTESGVYSVMTKTGKAQRAVVLNNVHRVNGTESDMLLVVGSTGASFQEKLAGVRCGDTDISKIEGSEPHGEGVFILKEAGVVLEPVKVLHTINDSEGTSYAYSHPLYGVGHLKVASVKNLVQVDTNVQLLPEDFAFVPLQFGARYSADAESMDKIATRRSRISSVSLISDGTAFSFSGQSMDTNSMSGLTRDEALLVLSDLGDSADGAYQKVANASAGSLEKFAVRKAEAIKTASTVDAELVDITNLIKNDLVKEAASLTNSETVDSVLSLNFINPENVTGYIDSIPTFEESASKLAELLVGVRLGLSDVPETAVSSALRGIERAIGGLKKLQVRANMV